MTMTPKENTPEMKAFWGELEEGVSKLTLELGEKHNANGPVISSQDVCCMFVSIVAQMSLEIEQTPEQYHAEHRVTLCRGMLDMLNAYHTFCDRVKMGMRARNN